MKIQKLISDAIAEEIKISQTTIAIGLVVKSEITTVMPQKQNKRNKKKTKLQHDNYCHINHHPIDTGASANYLLTLSPSRAKQSEKQRRINKHRNKYKKGSNYIKQ